MKRATLLATAMFASALAAAPAAAQENPNWKPHPAVIRAMAPMVPRATATARVVTTQHQITANGKRIRYRAIVTELPLNGADGTPAAVAVTTAYVAEGVKNAAARPVVFVWNGGPGAASMPLHMQAYGPRRIVGKGTPESKLVDNAYSLIDVADLVFVDPVGTGVSMPVKGKDASIFWSNAGDAQSVHQILAAWVKANGREASPKILIGESYGTSRALAVINEDAKDKALNIDGVALLSLAFGDRGAYGDTRGMIGPIAQLPTFAAVAWYHNKVDRAGRSAEQFYADALAFAQTDYAAALIRGNALTAAEKRKVAERMSGFIGLSPDLIEKADLQPGKEQFMLALIADRGERTGQLDGRAHRSIAESNVRPPFDDPSMSLGAESGDIMEHYLKDELGYAPPSEYRSLNLGINSKWNRQDSYANASYTGFLVAAMKANPNLMLFTGGGVFDLTTPTYAGEYTLDHADIPNDRRIHKGYAAGHSVFEDPEGLVALTTDMRAFIEAVVARKAAK
jgi:carboxypeptidase C (cathepsin A)